MPQSVRHTDDAGSRREFKNRQKAKLEQALTPPEPITPITSTQVNLPANFHTLSRSTLFGILTRERGLTIEDANEVIEVLDGIPSPRFTVVLQGKAEPTPAKPVPVAPVAPAPPREVALALPHNFKTFKVADKFLWLTKEGHLDFSEANDVIDLLDGKPAQTATRFTLSYAEPPAPPAAKPEVLLEKAAALIAEYNRVTLPEGYDRMTGDELYYALTLSSKLACTPENAKLAVRHLFGDRVANFELQTLDGTVVEPRIVAPVEPPRVAFTGTPTLAVEIPEFYKDKRPADIYYYLTHGGQLHPELANNVVLVLEGKPQSNVKFDITFVDMPVPAPVAEKPKAEKAVVKPTEFVQIAEELRTMDDPTLYRHLIMELGLAPEVADESIFQLRANQPKLVAEKPAAPPTPVYAVEIPVFYKNSRPQDIYYYLTHQGQLAPELANDAVALLEGKAQKLKAEFNITFVEMPVIEASAAPVAKPKPKAKAAVEFVTIPEDLRSLDDPTLYRHLTIEFGLPPEVADESIFQLRSQPKPIAAKPVVAPLAPIDLRLPKSFANGRASDQYQYLTLDRHLTPGDAADAMAALSGAKTTRVFNISWFAEEEVTANPVPEFLESRTQRKSETLDRAKSYSKPEKTKPVFKVTTPERKTLTVQMPVGIAKLRPREQHTYFTGVLHMAPDLASELVAHMSGQGTNTLFTIEYEEGS